MIDMGCFDTVAHAGADKKGSVSGWTANPHPKAAEEQALLLGLEKGADVRGLSPRLGRSPYPHVVEEQFALGIK